MRRTGAFALLASASMWCVPVAAAEADGPAVVTAAVADLPAAGALPQAPAIALDGDGYVPLTPARLLDTRPTGNTIDDQFEQGGTLGAGAAIELTVLDRGGVPASGVEAVVLQVTATSATVRTWISAYPHGTPGPATSNVNAVPGQVRSNLVIVPVGDDGKVDLWNASGTVHLIADVQGWIPSESTFTGVTPARLLDTRISGPALGAGAVRTVLVGGQAGIPAAGVGAVAINLTSVNASVRTWLTAYPSGSARPGSSNLNANGAAPEANLVIVPLGDDGEIDIHNALGTVDAIVDVLGWFPAGPGLVPIDPERVVDTRPGDPVTAGGTVTIDADAVPGVPAGGVGALVINITSLNATTSTWLTAYPTGAAVPLSSNANPRMTAVVANLAIVKVNADGELTIRNANGSVDVLVDVVAWLPSDVSAKDDEATVAEDAPATAVAVLANDSDADGRPLLIESVDQPANGTVVITGGGTGLTYQPDVDYCNDPPGTTVDTFTYHLFGGASADVEVVVTCVDDVTVAVADSATVGEDSGANTIDVRANDTDVEGPKELVVSVTAPTAGTAAVTNAGADVSYTPDADYCGDDEVSYTLANGSSTTVTVTVTCTDDPPVAVGDEATVVEDSADNVLAVTVNDTDVDGGPLSITGVSTPTHGSAVIDGLNIEYTPDANHCGDDSFTYTLSGGSTAGVDVTITCVDDVTVAVADSATVGEDSGANTIDVRANDTEVDGPKDAIVSVIQPSDGAVTITNGGNDLSFTPNAEFCGVTGFSYTLSGGASALVTVTVTCVDDMPVAVDDEATVEEDSGPTTIDVTANDTDVDGGPLALGSLGSPTFGTTSASGDDVVYTPNPNFCGDDTFTYTLSPGGDSATVTVTVTCVDDLPTPAADSYALTEDDGATSLDVLANDIDVDAGTKQVTAVGTPMLGSVTIDAGGTGLTYTPDPDECGIDTFNYTVNGAGMTTVQVDIACVDDAPVAVGDDATVAEDSGATAIDVLANDTDIDAGPLEITSVTLPANGTVVITGGGSGLTYQPDANYCNTPAGPDDEFTYTVNGGDVATVEVTVTCDDDLSIANDDTATVTQNDPATAIDVLANDSDVENDPFVITSVTQPPNGTVVITGGGTGLTYQPDVDYCNTPSDEPDDFSYTITGGDSADVEITVNCLDDPPTAVTDSATVAEDAGATAIDVLANDTDPDAGPIAIDTVTQPANGTVVITGGGTGLTYQPDPNYCNNPPGSALDTFTYTLTPGGSTATVSVTVTCVDDAPTAVNDGATVTEDASATAIDVLGNDTDLDGGSKLIVSVTQPANGTVAISPGNTGLTYAPNANYCNTPPGSTLDSFTYTLIPGSSTATVTVTVTCVDDNPLGVNDSATVVEDSTANTINVLANDTDVDGGSKSILLTTQPANGTVIITGGGASLSYTPNANYCNSAFGSTDNFTYTLAPGGSTGTVSVTVTCVDDAPVAVNDSATVVEDSGATTVDVRANDTDADGGPKSVSSVTQPANGAVVITGGGTGLSYQPDPNYCNNPPGSALDTFTYTLSPGGSVGTVSVTVTCVDDPPTAVGKGYDAVGNMRIDVASVDGLLVGANDVDGILPLTVGTVSATNPAGGVVTHNATTGSFSFTPPPGVTGIVTFTYTVCDSTAPTPVCSAPATVTVGVDGPAVWFVDDGATPTGANGTLDKPFPSLSALQADAAFTAATNPRVFVFGGTYNSGFMMPSGTRLFGQAYQTPDDFDTEFAITPVTGLQSRPAFNMVSTVTVSGQLTLGNNAFVRGLVLTPSSGAAISGSGVTGVDVRSSRVDVTGATGLELSGVAGILDLDEVSVDAGAHGVRLFNSSATVVVRDGDITNTTTSGVTVDGAGSSVTFFSNVTLGPIAAGRTLLVQNRGSGGSVTLSGPISATGGTGILLNNNNAASNVRLLGRITLSTGANPAFVGTSGGTVETAVSDQQSSITTTTGTGLSLTNTSIGADGVVFRSISVNGAANGIVLNNTGTGGGNGNLRVQGVASSAGSGGTIQNTTGAAISLTSTKSPTFRYFTIQNSAGSGVQGTGVAGFTFTNSTINNAGTGGSGSNLAFNTVDANNLSGSVTITDNTLTNARDHGIDILNYAGVITSVTISNNTITSSTIAASSTGSGIRLQALGNGGGAASVNGATLNANTITNFPSGGGIVVQGGNTAPGGPSVTFGTAGTPITVTSNSIRGESLVNPMNTNAIAAAVNAAGTAHFNISNNGTVVNPLGNVRGTVILVAVNDNATGTFTVNGNVIVANHAPASFGSNGIGGGTGTAAGNPNSTPSMTITANNNSVSGTDGDAMLLVARGASGLLKATVQNNTVGPPLSGNRYGIRIDAGNASSVTDQVCVNISGNTATGVGAGTGIGLRQQTGRVFGIVGLTPSPASAAQAQTFVGTANPGAIGGVTIISGTSFTSCTI